jgi:phosphoglycolate phosphatase
MHGARIKAMPEAAGSSRRFRLLVFDWDGTIADSTALIVNSLKAACADLGLPVPTDTDAHHVIGLGLADAARHVAPSLPRERYAELSAAYRARYLAQDDEIVLFDGVREMLEELELAGHLLAIATGKSRAGLTRALEQQGIAHRFTATRCADEGFPKPHPDMLLALMNRTGVNAGETLMIGDTTHDLELAQNAGAAALALTHGAHTSDALARFAPLATLSSIAELRAWLNANG